MVYNRVYTSGYVSLVYIQGVYLRVCLPGVYNRVYLRVCFPGVYTIGCTSGYASLVYIPRVYLRVCLPGVYLRFVHNEARLRATLWKSRDNEARLRATLWEN